MIPRYPDAADEITDCLSGDVNKDFSRLWSRIREFVPPAGGSSFGEPYGTASRKEAYRQPAKLDVRVVSRRG